MAKRPSLASAVQRKRLTDDLYEPHLPSSPKAQKTEKQDDGFKLTLYLPRDVVNELDRAWIEIRAQTRRAIPRSHFVQEAIHVALKHLDELRERLPKR